MTASQPQEQEPSSKRLLLLLVAITVVCLVIDHVPFASLAIQPVRQMTTLIHELGHATACVVTGGTVDGMTIVSDGQGHGGLTMTRGGWSFLIMPAGYLGAALVGALLLLAGRKREYAGRVLIALGVVLGIAGVVFTGTTFSGLRHNGQAGWSLVWEICIAIALVAAGAKLSPPYAHFLLLFLAVQVALNAVTDSIYLVTVSTMTGSGGSFTDATNMAQLTGVPAFIWSLLWCAVSIGMLLAAVRFGYLRRQPEK